MQQNTPRTEEVKGRHPGRERVSRALLTALLSAVVLLSVLMPSARAERSAKLVVYALDAANLTFRDEDTKHIDQINYSFALLRDGEADGSHWVAIDRLRAYLRRHPAIRGVMAVGGWGAEGFSDACTTAEGRKRLADSILRLMDENGFRGVDIDWEYPGTAAGGIKSRPEDVENWYALLMLLREGMDARSRESGLPYTLSVAVGAGDSLLAPIDAARLNPLVDQVVVMAYDLCGFDRQTGHHAGLYPDDPSQASGSRAVRTLTQGGLSAEKILLGFPAYGRMWRQVSGSGVTQTAGISGTKVLTFPELLALEENGYTRRYDDAAKATYWTNGSSFVSGEDAQSLRDKAQWAVQQGLQGAAVWSLGQDATGQLLAWLAEGLSGT